MSHGCIFASQAEVGKQYVTKGGCPITVLEMGAKIKVRDDLMNHVVALWADALLWPFTKDKINKESIQMAKALKQAKGSKATGKRGGDRGAKKVADGIQLYRQVGDVVHEVLYHEGILSYRNKDYDTLKEVAVIIRGKAISGSGKSFFGLREEGNVVLGKEVWKGLKDACAKAAVKPPKAKKAKRVKDEVDESEVTKSKATGVAGVVAKVFGKARG